MPANRKAPDDPLSAYRAKRSLDRTPEPGARAVQPGSAGGLFVVHQHAARNLHFDLRLEMKGVLTSWAVPKGPSKNPADKRLAVHVEDHPFEYGDFEGLIPEGNYGAGAVIVWDRGRWVPVEDPFIGLEKGKLLFELHGYKLKGLWTLVKIKRGEKEWLLIKERDGEVSENGTDFPPNSVLSGLTVEELKAGADRAGPIRDELARLKVPRRDVTPTAAEPMLAETREGPFTKDGWLFELKLDGYRVRVGKENGVAKVVSRNGHDLSPVFPEIARVVAALPFEGLVLDGELVVLDERGHPTFNGLQNRARISRGFDVRRAAVESPTTMFCFDLLAFGGYDTRGLTLEKRKDLLRKVIPATGALRYSEHFVREGEALYRQVERLGLEGIMAKRADSTYRAGRSPAWLKIRADRADDFVVVGFTKAKGSRAGFGALHLGAYRDGALVYVGRAGSGFTDKELKEVAKALESLKRDTPPVTGPIPNDKDTSWIEPKLVAEVRFKEWTPEALLRHPVFLRWRDDKEPGECVLTAGSGEEGVVAVQETGDTAPVYSDHSPLPAPRDVVFSNLKKIFWPDDGYTKGDLIEYYRAISPWLLPYLADRPVVMTRFPDGITGKSFFQKDAPPFSPDWLRTERMWSEDTQREIDYFVCDDLDSLLYLANLGTIPLHVWGSRIATLERPDWCILDLDPKEAAFTDVVKVAKATKRLCDHIGLPAYIKTSGSTGLHVLIPMGRQVTYEQCRQLGGLLARVVAAELPDIATIARVVGKRGGRVYLDYGQNGHGRLLVAPYSIRPLPGAPVSMPLKWSEVTPSLEIGHFTIKNTPARMKKLKGDPVIPVLDEQPDLVKVLGLLQERV
ncbi:MAG TPA: DNA ligase D [Gemmatimonadales bacterium]|nr:DNA ligase D [Gemmatimonadales bacterium]